MAATTLAQALLAFQAEGVALQKDAINPHFKNRYISLDSLTATVLPVLNKCGLVVLQMPCESNGVPALTTRIIHAESGESVEATMPLMLQKQDPQSQGSAITYARRYALMSVLGLVADEDTDGHTARPGSGGATAQVGESRPKAGAEEEEAPRASAPATNNGHAVVDYATDGQKRNLNRLIGLLRPEHITTEWLWDSFPKKKREVLEDGELHWRTLRDSLSKQEANDLLNYLLRKEAEVAPVPFQ